MMPCDGRGINSFLPLAAGRTGQILRDLVLGWVQGGRGLHVRNSNDSSCIFQCGVAGSWQAALLLTPPPPPAQVDRVENTLQYSGLQGRLHFAHK